MYVFICLLVLLPLQASGAALTLSAEPYRQEIEKVRRHNVAYGFSQTASGEFQIQVTVRYRPTWSRLEHVKHVMFRLQNGTIVQRDPKTLILRLEDREVVVGKHRWWYHPYWQAADNVRIACDNNKQFMRVVVENCRLILEGPAGYGPSSAGISSFRPLQPWVCKSMRWLGWREAVAIRHHAKKLRDEYKEGFRRKFWCVGVLRWVTLDRWGDDKARA